MRYLILSALLLASVCHAKDVEKFEAYRQRRYDRWSQAISIRRQMNAGKIHVYGPIFVPVSVAPRPMIEQGWVYQPPIRYDVPTVSLITLEDY